METRASKIRSALEQALDLCNGMSLEEQQKYPRAAMLVPVLHELLEQDEECAAAGLRAIGLA